MFTIRKNLILLLFLSVSIIFTALAYGYEIWRGNGYPLHWEDSDLPVPFVINSAGTPDIVESGDYSGGEFEAIRSSFQTWEDVLTSYLCFSDYGIISRTITNFDGINLLIWRESGWSYGQNVIALTSVWYKSSNGAILDADIEFNGVDFVWTTNSELCDPFDCPMDVQNIATHEIGHVFGLGHSEDTEATMYGTVGPSTLVETKKRDLAQDDVDGVSTLYPTIVVTIITPTFGTNEDIDFPVIISGISFEEGALVKLTQDLRPDITVSAPTVSSSSTISADLDLYGKPVGLWDVWVINPDGGKGFLSRGFEVFNAGTNFPPVAQVAVPYQAVFVGSKVVLDGSGSYDPDGDNLYYSWDISEEPVGSSISLSGPASPYPQFTPTHAGTYIFELVVSDGVLSESANVIISATFKIVEYKDKSEGCACKTIGPSGREGARAETIFLNLFVFLLPLVLIFLRKRFKDSKIMSNVKVQMKSKVQTTNYVS